MAFETSTSAAPGSTSTPDPNATLGFTPSASPPIIVAFLSVGLFVAGMLSIRFWRLHQSRIRAYGQRGHVDVVGGWNDVEKPVLWNLCADETKNAAMRWKDIMPLSVNVTTLDGGHGAPASEQFRPSALRYCDAIRTRFYVQKEKEASVALAEHRRRLQVAVLIALPRQWRTREKAGGDEGLEYSLGLFDAMMHVEPG